MPVVWMATHCCPLAKEIQASGDVANDTLNQGFCEACLALRKVEDFIITSFHTSHALGAPFRSLPENHKQPTQEPVLAREKLGRDFGKNRVEWTEKGSN